MGEKPFTFLENWSFEYANKPGALRELLRKKDYRESGGSLSDRIAPAYRERVLKAVAKAVERNDSTFAPIARIGSGRGGTLHVQPLSRPQ